MDPELEELDKYLTDIADISDASDDTPDPNEQVAPDGASDDTADDRADDSDTPAEVNDRPKAASEEGKQPAKSAEAPKKGTPRRIGRGIYTDDNGDILNERGQVVAKAGAHARLFMSNSRLQAQNEELMSRLNDVMRASEEVKAFAQVQQHYGLSQDDIAQALDLAGRMKRGDHVGVARDIVAMLVAQGHNVTDLLGQDVGDSIETKAIKQMIDERLAPITREEQARRSREEAEQRGRAAYNAFVAQNEFADVHASEIVNIMRSENVEAQAAYNRLMSYAHRNGFDVSKPLPPQIEEALKREQNSSNNRGDTRAQKPMPHGAATRHNSGAIHSSEMDSSEDDWGTIISRAQQAVRR